MSFQVNQLSKNNIFQTHSQPMFWEADHESESHLFQQQVCL